MSKSFEREPTKGNVEPVTKRATRIAEATRAIIASLNEAVPPYTEPLPIKDDWDKEIEC